MQTEGFTQNETEFIDFFIFLLFTKLTSQLSQPC